MSSSLLLGCDLDSDKQFVKMIDFVHCCSVEHGTRILEPTDKDIDHGYIRGLNTLISYLEELLDQKNTFKQ